MGRVKAKHAPPDRIRRRPPVQFLSAVIPIGNDVAHITDKNRVVHEIEQTGLLGSHPPLTAQVRRAIAEGLARRDGGPRG